MADPGGLREPAIEMDRRTVELGTAPLGPLMVKLSIPGMVGMLTVALYNLIDTYWVSGLPEGTKAVAALTVLFPFQMVAGAIGMGTSAGVMSLVARRFGAGRTAEANQAAGHGVVLALWFGAGFGALGLLVAEPLVRALGATPEIVGPSVAFLRTASFGFPCSMLVTVLSGMLRGAGNNLVPMFITLSGAVLTAVLDPFWIYGWGPFPRLEIQGAAVATVIGQVASCAVAVGYLRGPRSGYRIRRQDLRLRWPVVRDIAEVGAPAAATFILRSLVASIANHVLGRFGPAAIAAMGISNRIFFLVIAVLGGSVNQALTPIAGYAFGARNYRRLWQAYTIAAVWTSVGGLLLGALIIVFAPAIVGPMAHEPELLRLGVIALRLQLCTFFLVEPQMMAVFTLQGMGMGTWAMWLTLLRSAILVLPLLFLLTARFGVVGAFATQPTADVLALVVTVVAMRQVYRRYPPQTESNPAVALAGAP